MCIFMWATALKSVQFPGENVTRSGPKFN